MGVYVKRIMCEELRGNEEDIVREEPLTDFGGIDPTPSWSTQSNSPTSYGEVDMTWVSRSMQMGYVYCSKPNCHVLLIINTSSVPVMVKSYVFVLFAI